MSSYYFRSDDGLLRWSTLPVVACSTSPIVRLADLPAARAAGVDLTTAEIEFLTSWGIEL